MPLKYKIKKESIPSPQVRFTDKAWKQLNLIIDNDFTLQGKYFRILISGKNCDGPLYSTGMADEESDDLKLTIHKKERTNTILIDPFSAFYLQNITVDYVQNFTENREGFVVINPDQQKYAGKFWIKDPKKIPPGRMRWIQEE